MFDHKAAAMVPVILDLWVSNKFTWKLVEKHVFPILLQNCYFWNKTYIVKQNVCCQAGALVLA